MRSDREAGMVTAELAVCLPVLVLLLAVALSTVSVASSRIRVADVAREAARLAARGDTAGIARLEADVAPIHISIRRSAGEVTATAKVNVGLWGSAMPAVIGVDATVVAAVEPAGVP